MNKQHAKEDFAERLRLAAQEVVESAEEIVGDHGSMTEVKVTITVRTIDDGGLDPDIQVSKQYYSNGVTDYLRKGWVEG